ncbi:hypothetical protein BDV12DRAFT_59420 [Aspergillus spectabilis]
MGVLCPRHLVNGGLIGVVNIPHKYVYMLAGGAWSRKRARRPSTWMPSLHPGLLQPYCSNIYTIYLYTLLHITCSMTFFAPLCLANMSRQTLPALLFPPVLR